MDTKWSFILTAFHLSLHIQDWLYPKQGQRETETVPNRKAGEQKKYESLFRISRNAGKAELIEQQYNSREVRVV